MTTYDEHLLAAMRGALDRGWCFCGHPASSHDMMVDGDCLKCECLGFSADRPEKEEGEYEE